MANFTFKGTGVQIKGEAPKHGDTAADFTFVKEDLSEGSLSEYDGKVKVIMAVPSLDTGVCQTEAKKFNEKLQDYKSDVVGLVVSKDLPFAMQRFCSNEGIENVVSASDFRYGDFSNEYNLEMIDGPLKGLLARTVYVVDKDNKISYVEFVNEVTDEPDYSSAMNEVKKVLDQ